MPFMCTATAADIGQNFVSSHWQLLSLKGSHHSISTDKESTTYSTYASELDIVSPI
jgi:esterase/lipase